MMDFKDDLKLGDKYYHGIEVGVDYDIALQHYREAAKKGSSQAYFMLGYMYEQGYGIDKNANEAIDCYKIAAEKGSIEAGINLANLFLYKRNHKEAVTWFEWAGEKGNKTALYNLASLYEKGMGVGRNVDKAISLYTKLAEQGEDDAKYLLWLLLETKNFSLARRYLEEAANNGHSASQFQLGYLYDVGKYLARNEKLAREWYTKSAENKNADAMYNLGLMLAKNEDNPKEVQEAFKWFEKAAGLGHVLAKFSVACMYYQGIGVKQNNELAFKYYKEAADSSNEPGAQFMVGLMLAEGKGAEKNLSLSKEYFTKSANKGYPLAQVNLAKQCLADKDLIEARKWFKVAEFFGKYQDSINIKELVKDDLALLEKQMTEGEIKRSLLFATPKNYCNFI
jgi:TPR repeat protein